MARRFSYFESSPVVLYNQFYAVWRAALSVLPDPVYDAALNQLFQDLDDAGLLGVSPSDPTGRKIEYAYLLANFSEEAAALSLVDITKTSSKVNSPTFGVGVGYTGLPARTAYLDSNFIDNSGTYWTVGNGHLGTVVSAWASTNTTFSVGNSSTTNSRHSRIRNRHAGGALRANIQTNSGLAAGSISVPTGVGFSMITKGSGVEQLFKDGVLINPSMGQTDIGTLNSSSHKIGATITSSVSAIFSQNETINFVTCGADLNSTEVAAYNAALKTYFDTLGVISPIP